MKDVIAVLGLLSLASMFLGTAFALIFFGFGMAIKVFIASALLVLFFLLITE
jgi:hypothetical protein